MNILREIKYAIGWMKLKNKVRKKIKKRESELGRKLTAIEIFDEYGIRGCNDV